MCRLEEVAVGTGLGSFEALSWSMFVWWIRVRVGTLVDANFGVRIVAGAEDAWFQRLVLGCLRGKLNELHADIMALLGAYTSSVILCPVLF